jgi:myosin protein heavy chain
MAQAKINRKHEKKMKENLIMLDDERRHADQYKEQAEKVSIISINSLNQLTLLVT